MTCPARSDRIRLPQDRLDNINRALRAIHDVQQDIASLRECGEDCTDYQEISGQLIERLTSLKQRFGS